MSLQELPRTVATGAVKLVRLPLEFANGARELIADRIGGDDEQPTASMPTTQRAKPKPRKPAARTKPRPAARPRPKSRRAAATKPKTAKPKRTPASKSPAAERPGVVAEQTEGLEDATDRAIEERRSLG